MKTDIVLTELLQAMQDSINHYKTIHMDASITLPLTVYPMQLADVTIEEEYHNEHSGIYRRHHGTSCLEEKQTVTLTEPVDTQTNGALFYDNDQTLYF